MSSRIEQARRFAEAAHASVNHRRKYTGEAYINHPAAVAALVADVTDDEETLCAAWLHDVVEDTPVTIDEIAQAFGVEVAGLVADLTDVSRPEDGNRKTRKAIDREHLRRADPRAKTVKLADLIDNVRSISRHDPHFAKVYMVEKRLLLGVLREGDATLYTMATQLLAAYERGERPTDS